MALFGNQDKKTIEELENYYANRPNRSGMAWMMAFLSLLVTVAVLSGLFFGGRWAYRALTDDDREDVASSATSDDSQNGQDDSTITISVGDDTDGDGVVTDEAASTDELGSGENDTSDSGNAAAVAGDASELPDTGANTLAVMVTVPTVSGIVGYTIARRRAHTHDVR